MTSSSSTSSRAPVTSLSVLLSDPKYRRPFLLVLALMALQQLSGVNVVVFYSQSILAHSALDPGLSSTAIAAAQVAGGAASLMAVDRFGRRPLLLASQCSVAVCTFMLGYYFYLKEKEEEMKEAVPKAQALIVRPKKICTFIRLCIFYCFFCRTTKTIAKLLN